MKLQLRGVLLFLCISLSASARVEPEVPARDPKLVREEAKTHFQRGVQLYKEGDFLLALSEFKLAYSLVPNFRALYNIGQTSFQLQKYAEALDAFEHYLLDGAAEVPTSRQKEVQGEIEKLRSRVTLVIFKVLPTDVDLTIDDETVPAPYVPLRLSAGHHVLRARHTGYVPVTRTLELPGGETAHVDVDLEIEARPIVVEKRIEIPTQVTPLARVAPMEAPMPSRMPLYIALLSTSALTVGAVTTGLLALSAKSDLDGSLAHVPGDRSAIDSSRSRAKTFALTTDILGAAAILSAGLTIDLALTSRRSTRVAVTPQSVSVSGQF